MKTQDRALVLVTPAIRQQLKILAASTGETMKDLIARLVADELKRSKKSKEKS